MTTRTRTWTIEVDWFCGSCGARNPGMTGTERESLKCRTCGHEKTQADKEAELDPSRVLTGKLDAEARKGPTWTCAFCQKESRQGRKTCEVCGAPRESARMPPRVVPQDVVDRLAAEGLPVEAVDVPTLFPATEATVLIPPPPKVLRDTVKTTHYGTLPKAAPKPPPPAPPTPPKVTHYREPAAAATPPPAPRYVGGEDLDESLTDRLYGVPWGKIGVVVLLALFVIGGAVFLCTDRETTVRVGAMHWRRELVEETRTEHEGEGWRDEARGVLVWHRCEERQDGTHDCNPHSCRCRQVSEECNCTGGNSYDCNCRDVCSTSCSSNRNGSGTCTETCRQSCSTCTTPRRCSTCSRAVCDTCYDQCPTMRTWCAYRYERWTVTETQVREGAGPIAEWPVLSGAAQGDVAPGPNRRITPTEHYTVRFDEVRGTDSWTRNVPWTLYTTYRVGQKHRAIYNLAGSFRVTGSAR